MRAVIVFVLAAFACSAGLSVQAAENRSIDPLRLFVAEPMKHPVTILTEPVVGSDIPVDLTYVETRDGMFASLGMRKPKGDGPFPVILFTYGNGGMGMRWVREWTSYAGGTQEEFLKAGYAVAWVRYRAEIDNVYNKLGKLEVRERTNRPIFSRGLYEYEDVIDVISYVKTLPYIDPDRIGYVGVSHGGEMLMKIAAETNLIRAGIASEPAASEFLAMRPRPRGAAAPETAHSVSAEEQARAVAEARQRVDMAVAGERLKAINTAIFVQGRDRDHNQDVFRLSYELLKEAGKDVEWKSYDHDVHGFIHVRRNQAGVYAPDSIQQQAVRDSIAYFDRHMK